MERPEIFDETINKKTSSRNKSTIQYERGTLSQENRVYVESIVNDAKYSKLPEGYDGGIIKKEFIDFEKEYPGLTFKKTDFLYDRMMNDARNVFPRNRDLKNKVSTYFNEMIRINLNNIYHYAPRFFTENFVQRTTINNTAFESYQVYIYLLCFINWTDKHRNDTDVRDFDNIDKILNWIATRRDPSIEFIINGPSSNSDITNNDFRSHYKTLIDASNDMSSIIAYNQLSSTQTISSDVYNLIHIIQNMPNVFFKNPDEARKYNINIDSAQDVMVTIDNDNNLIFDCSYVNLGDVTEQNKLAKFDNLESVITNNKVNSMINTKKLAELFHNYSRIKILELIITPDAYISSLDAFNKVFVVFKGVSCSERNVYNTIPTNYLKIGGKFIRTNRGYEFKMDVDAITYKSVLADVKSFEVYLTLNPNHTNQIIPNEYALSFSKHNIYQHPITTDVVYDSKVRGQRKIVTIREQSNNDNTINSIPSINSKRKTINLMELLTTSSGVQPNSQTSQLIVNGKFSTANDPKNRLPRHAKTNIPTIDQYLFGDETANRPSQSFSNMLYQLVKVSDPTDKSSVVASIDKSIQFARKASALITDSYYTHFINRVIELLSDIRTSWTLDEKLDSMELSLTTNSKLTEELKNELTKIINSNFIRLINRAEFSTICDSYNELNQSDITTIRDISNQTSLTSKADKVETLLRHDTTTEQSIKSKIMYYTIYGDSSDLSNSITPELIIELHKMATSYETDILGIVNVPDDIEQGKTLTTEQINKSINAVRQYTNISYKAQEFAQTALLETQNTSIINKLKTHQILTAEELDTIISSMTSFTSYSDDIPDMITNITSLTQDQQQILTNILNRSLILSTDELTALLTGIGSIDSSTSTAYLRVLKYDYSNVDQTNLNIYKDEFNNYRQPLTTQQQQMSLINQLQNYANDKQELVDDVENDNITTPETEQLLAIISSYYSSLEKDKPYEPSDFVAFMCLVQSSKYFTIDDYSAFILKDDTDLNNLNQLFYKTSNNINGYIKSNIDFITNYSEFIDNYQVIGSLYRTYYTNILSTMSDDIATTIKELNIVFSNFKTIYTILYNLLDPNVIIDNTVDYTYRNVEVDTRTATIEGKYFRVNSNNFAYFDGIDTPDPNYLIYTEDENDLTLINLYTKYNEVIQPVIKGSFIYSESLGTIQNLSSSLFDYTGIQNVIRFDNNYNTNKGNTQTTTYDPNHLISASNDADSIYYTYYSKSYGLILSNVLDTITTDLSVVNNITTTTRWSQEEATIKSEILINFDENLYNSSNKTFEVPDCLLTRYDYHVGDSEASSSYIQSTTTISASLTFIKIDDVSTELIINPDVEQAGVENNNGKISYMYYVMGTVKSVNKSGSAPDAWDNIAKDELVCFVARLAMPNVNPADIMPHLPNGASSYRTNRWIVYTVSIEPSLYGEVGDFTITDTLGNQTTITKYFNMSFINSLGFSSIDDIITNPDSPYTDLNNEIYAKQSVVERDTYIYTINYVYNRPNSTFSIITNIEKEGVETQYREYITMSLNQKLVYRWSVNHLTTLRENEEQELLPFKIFTNQTIDLLRNSTVDNPAVGYIDYYHFEILEKHNDENAENSNNYKAYSINGLDVKKTYWNKTAFINSLMLCPVASMIKDPIDPEYSLLTETVEYDGKTDNVVIYNYDNGFTNYDNRFVISPNDITSYDDNDNEISGTIFNLFVNRNQKINCYTEFEETLADGIQTKTYYITNADNKYYFQLVLTSNEDVITSLKLKGIKGLIENTILSTTTNDNIDMNWISLGQVDTTISSGHPVYVYYKDIGFEIIINYESQFSEFPISKQITISSIGISYIKYSTIHFKIDPSDNEHKVSYAPIETVKYSNIPSSYCDESDVLFSVLGQIDTVFKLSPVFKYYEKCIVSPRYIDENGDYILLASKYNQNIMAKPVYLRSQYNLNNPTNNSIKDSPDVVYKIGNRLDPNKKHLLESINKSMIMLGSVENDGTISETAIRANKIHAIPTASKMLMSVEFS